MIRSTLETLEICKKFKNMTPFFHHFRPGMRRLPSARFILFSLKPAKGHWIGLILILTLYLGCTNRGKPIPSAPLQSPTITVAEFDLYTLAQPRSTQEMVARDPEIRRKVAGEFLQKWLYAHAAQETGHPNMDSLRRRVSLLDKMAVAQFYQWTYLGENLGANRDEIQTYFKRYPEKFRDSSGQFRVFSWILEEVADSLALSKANLDSFYQASGESFSNRQPEFRRRMAEKYLIEAKQKLIENSAIKLKEKYQVRLVRAMRTPTDAEIAEYYAKNKDAYVSPDGFDLYHIETAHPNKLRAQVSAVTRLGDFQALAKRHSVNPWTKTKGGQLGVVKRDFCLPYGLGLMPALFPALDGLSSGRIQEPLQSSETGTWHFFWLERKVPSSLKPLNRVKVLVAQDLVTNGIASITPDDTLAVIPGRKAILEKDIVFLREEFPMPLRQTFTRENLVHFLLEREIAMAEAESVGLFKDERLKALRYANELSFWSQFYVDSVLHPAWNGDTAAWAELFSRKPHAFTKDPGQKGWRPSARDLAAYSGLSQTELDIEYRTNKERYMQGDSLPPLEWVEFDVFQTLKSDAYRRLDAKIFADIQNRFRVRIDSSLTEPKYERAESFLQEAEKLYRARKLEQALRHYETVREIFPRQNALQCSVTLEIARIHLELQHYQSALGEYRRASMLYPDVPSQYKALFMEGFILAEHFKSDSAAIRIFESMLKKYPKSELSKEADWMIRNIRSGGGLMSAPKPGN
jgi:PPIC-type PPIASE domain/Outer membrane lipoprotein